MRGALPWERDGLETRAAPPFPLEAPERPLPASEPRCASATTLLTIRTDPNRTGAIRSIRLNFDMALDSFLQNLRSHDSGFHCTGEGGLAQDGTLGPGRVSVRRSGVSPRPSGEWEPNCLNPHLRFSAPENSDTRPRKKFQKKSEREKIEKKNRVRSPQWQSHFPGPGEWPLHGQKTGFHPP